jgi:hypothetical protein
VRRAILTLVSAFALLLGAADPAGAATVWTRVGAGSTQGISGAAPASGPGWVLVRDNKTAGQNRVALLSTTGVVTPLAWPGTAPQDLEAIAAVPGQAGRYAVVTSAGAGRLVTVSGTTLTVGRSFTLPVGRDQNEGFALVVLGGTTVAVWGNRGASATPGRVYAATFTVGTGAFGAVAQGPVAVPYPTGDVRHVSDLAMVAGRIVVSSAADPGDDGPFASAVDDVGALTLASGRARLALTPPTSLGTYPGHKVEAIACRGASGILGTDDENLGGWLTAATFCR